MSSSSTYSTTYTVADIGKVVDCFAADFDMLAQATGLTTREEAWRTSADIKVMAQRGYLKEVNIYLQNAAGTIIRAAKYEVSTDAGLWTAQRPGNNLWPRTPGGELGVVIVRTSTWWALSEAQKVSFMSQLQCTWGTSSIDTAFPSLTRNADRDYASNSFGMRKSVYN